MTATQRELNLLGEQSPNAPESSQLGPPYGCWHVLCVETERDETQLTLDKNTQNCKEFFLSWIVYNGEAKKI